MTTFHFNESQVLSQISATAKNLCIGIVGRAGAGKTRFAAYISDKLGLMVVNTDQEQFSPLKGVINEGFGCIDYLNRCDLIIYLDTPASVAMNVYKYERKGKKAEFCLTQWESANRQLQNYTGCEILYCKTSWWCGTDYDTPYIDMESECRNYKARASHLYALLTDPISANEKETGELSKTAKTMLRKWYITKKYGVYLTGESKHTKKGNAKEDDAIQFAGEWFGADFEKNKTQLIDDYFSGTCDILHETNKGRYILDTKCSFNIFTFADAKKEDKKEYLAQMQVYMHLWKAQKAYICFCLLNTPDDILQKEISDMEWRAERDGKGSDWIADQKVNITRLGKPEDYIGSDERIYIVEVNFVSDVIEKAKGRIEKAREFLVAYHNEMSSVQDKIIL